MNVTIKHKDSRTMDTVRGKREGSSRVQVTEFSLPEKEGNSGCLGTERVQGRNRWMSLCDEMSPQTVRLP